MSRAEPEPLHSELALSTSEPEHSLPNQIYILNRKQPQSTSRAARSALRSRSAETPRLGPRTSAFRTRRHWPLTLALVVGVAIGFGMALVLSGQRRWRRTSDGDTPAVRRVAIIESRSFPRAQGPPRRPRHPRRVASAAATPTATTPRRPASCLRRQRLHLPSPAASARAPVPRR